MASHIAETASRVRDLARNGPHDIEWIVVRDGPGELPKFTGPEVTVIEEPARHVGVPTCRNIALGMARNEWVMPLDADDLLDAEGVTRALDLAQATASYWIAGNITLLDGRRAPHRRDEPATFEVGELETMWTAPFAFFPNAIMARRDAALEIGGWPALPAADDLGYVLRLNAQFPGLFVPLTFFAYRYSPGQVTRADGHLAAKIDSFEFLRGSINARRRRHGLSEVSAPDLAALSRKDGTPVYWPSEGFE